MKLSTETQAILQNFSGINQSIMIREGNHLSTISASKNILANAMISEMIPKEFGIYDLTKFLGVMKIYEDRLLEFGEEYIVIRNANNTKQYTRFYYSDPSVIIAPPQNKKISFPENPNIKFTMSQKDFQNMIKGASVMDLPEILIRGNEGQPILISGIDTNNSSMGSFNQELEDVISESDFSFKINLENLTKLISGEYDISFSEKGISRFYNTTNGVEYFIAVQLNDDDDEED
jgi:hypothetical protein